VTELDKLLLLTEEERGRLIELLCDQRITMMFGDGLETDYVMDGFPTDPGLRHMSDLELLIELGHYETGATPEQMAEVWREELKP
jgi:hypothetical protein